ncbi:LPS export ABC transporter periplasmic protein LptC [Roseovarius sp. EL26]|uniref:LPS export ABC transporter periplasmic protein LptC n=1 Tax=Roseovarius sp. EL26 TaxID=2126672 RepID=UPI000EA3F9E0|nr:LPS export ABC transporter periplasmic protein LptC [Roseovarius sp. EL26]
MAQKNNFHSQLVAWMKIILPLIALGLLSTVFLLSEKIDPTKAIPFSKIDLEKRAQDLGATNPSFSGLMNEGHEMAVQAVTALPDKNDAQKIFADTVTAQIVLTSGEVIDIVSDTADLHQANDTAALMGNVNITTADGYRVVTDWLNTRTDTLYADTPGTVTSTGPLGDLEAGRMILTSDPITGDAHLHFTDGVTVVYQPQSSKE